MRELRAENCARELGVELRAELRAGCAPGCARRTRELHVDVGGDGLEGLLHVVGPERVGGLEVVRLLRRRARPALALLVDRQPVEAHAEDVVAEGAVRPAVLHHRAEVGGAVEEHEERPLVPRRVRLREEAPSRVRLELVVQTLLQPLGHRLRRPAARVAQDGHDAHRDEHREERADDRVDRRLDGGVGGALQRGVRARLHQREQVLLEARKVGYWSTTSGTWLTAPTRASPSRAPRQRPRHRREVDVVRVVARAVPAEPLHVRAVGCTK